LPHGSVHSLYSLDASNSRDAAPRDHPVMRIFIYLFNMNIVQEYTKQNNTKKMKKWKK